MSTLTALAALVLRLSLSAPAPDAPTRLELEVGTTATVGGASGMCDDTSVATITLGAQAVISALKPGTTTCSARVNGLRRVYQVVVTAPVPVGVPAALPSRGSGSGSGSEGTKR
jgi:ABC-type xylose transport system permease subunit